MLAATLKSWPHPFSLKVLLPMSVTIQIQHSKKKESSDGTLLGLGSSVLAPGAASKAYAALQRLVGSAWRTARSSLQIHTALG